MEAKLQSTTRNPAAEARESGIGRGMELSAVRIPKPFCRLEEAAFFLDVSLNRAHAMWQNEDLPRVLAQDGTQWMPGGKRLVRAVDLERMLDADGRAHFWRWQRDELRIALNSGARDNRNVPVRLLPMASLPPHGTLARYHRGCACGACHAANSVYMKNYYMTRRGAS